MTNHFTGVCVGSSSFFILKPQEPGAIDKQTSSSKLQSPSRPGDSLFGLRLKRPAGAVRVKCQSKPAGREANAPQPQGLAFALLGLPCFLLASGRRRQKTGKQTAQKNKESAFYRPVALATAPRGSRDPLGFGVLVSFAASHLELELSPWLSHHWH
jgi:hypothetical protein